MEGRCFLHLHEVPVGSCPVDNCTCLQLARDKLVEGYGVNWITGSKLNSREKIIFVENETSRIQTCLSRFSCSVCLTVAPPFSSPLPVLLTSWL